MSIISWLWSKIYDKNLKDAEERCLREWRASLLLHSSQVVLEIGCGTGLNLEHYPLHIEKLILAEPDKHMRQRLHEKLNGVATYPVEVLDCAAETLALPDASCDVVVSTLVLCTVKNQEKALAEIYRVLKPQGRFLFIEHIAAENNPKRLSWQKKLEPLWKYLTCGCHITRRTEAAIKQAGFSFTEISQQSMRGVPPIVRPSIRGIAVKTEGIA